MTHHPSETQQLKAGDQVRTRKDGKAWWTVQVAGHRYSILTRQAPSRPKGEYLYTIVDNEEGVRGPSNFIGNGWDVSAYPTPAIGWRAPAHRTALRIGGDLAPPADRPGYRRDQKRSGQVSELLEPGAVYRGLQEVQEGADPADVYARLMEDAIDPEDAILEEYIEATEEDHDNEDCLVKFRRNGFCFGTSCKHLDEGLRIQTLCPCKCHEGEDL